MEVKVVEPFDLWTYFHCYDEGDEARLPPHLVQLHHAET
jgi:hypothetical protein